MGNITCQELVSFIDDDDVPNKILRSLLPLFLKGNSIHPNEFDARITLVYFWWEAFWIEKSLLWTLDNKSYSNLSFTVLWKNIKSKLVSNLRHLSGLAKTCALADIDPALSLCCKLTNEQCDCTLVCKKPWCCLLKEVILMLWNFFVFKYHCSVWVAVNESVPALAHWLTCV